MKYETLSCEICGAMEMEEAPGKFSDWVRLVLLYRHLPSTAKPAMAIDVCGKCKPPPPVVEEQALSEPMIEEDRQTFRTRVARLWKRMVEREPPTGTTWK